MLNRRRDDVSTVSECRFTEPANGEVVCFSPTRSEDDLILLRVGKCRDLATRAINCRASLLPVTMNARRIAEILDHGARHRRRDTWVDGRRGAVIQVNSACWHQIQLRWHLNRSLP